jgi:hypothetical protein
LLVSILIKPFELKSLPRNENLGEKNAKKVSGGGALEREKKTIT